MKSRSKTKFNTNASLTAKPAADFPVKAPYATYKVVCRGPDGETKWTEEFRNLVVTEGRNDVLNKYFKGSSYTAVWYVGLKSSAGGTAAGDTLASHAGWTETTSYSGNRKAVTFGTVSAGSVDNSGSPCSFAMTGTVTVYGCFLATVDTGTSGTLYSVGDFSLSKAVTSGDTLSVTVTLTMADDGV